jgi:hypothetical protein
VKDHNPRVEAGYNNSTVALRVAEGDEKRTRAGGYNWTTLSLGNINTGTWSTRLGVGRKELLDLSMAQKGLYCQWWWRMIKHYENIYKYVGMPMEQTWSFKCWLPRRKEVLSGVDMLGNQIPLWVRNRTPPMLSLLFFHYSLEHSLCNVLQNTR